VEHFKEVMRSLTRGLLAFGLVGLTGYLLVLGIEVPGELWTLDGGALAFYYQQRREAT